MLEIFQYSFITRALITGIFFSIGTAIIGNFIVASRQSIISDMLAHTALAGVGIGFFLDFNPILTAVAVVFVNCIILWLFWHKKKFPPEALAMLLLTGSLALAILFIHLDQEANIDLESFLFGDILTITTIETYLFSIFNLFVLIFILLNWNRFLSVSLDRNFAKSRFKNVSFFEITLILMLGIIVASSLKVIGGLLVSAMLIIPVLSAQVVSNSFKQSVFLSLCFNILAVLVGITCSFYLDIPTSSAIVLLLIFEFILMLVFKQFFRLKI